MFGNWVAKIKPLTNTYRFKLALFALVVGIIANAVVSIFSSHRFPVGLGNFVSTVTEFLASYFICTGIVNLAERCQDTAVGAKARKARALLTGIFMMAALLSLLSAIFFKLNGLMTVTVGT